MSNKKKRTREKTRAKWEPDWDLAAIREALDEEEWVDDDEGFGLIRSISLGSVFSITPSGKYYLPFACGNLDDCPVCGGTGDVRTGLKRRVVRKWKNESTRRRRLWIKRFGWAPEWPARTHALSDALNKKLARTRGECARCGGMGSHEAYDDERWRERTEKMFATIGVSLEASEGDGTWLIATEWREKTKEEKAAEEKAAEDEDEGEGETNEDESVRDGSG